MQDQTAKQDAIEAISRLPDNVAFDEIIYRLHVLNKTHQGMKDIDAGRVVSSDDLAQEIEQW
jgi:predicted transcriptional regulator